MAWSQILIAGVPGLLVTSALVSGLRPAVAIALAAGWVGLRVGSRTHAIAWAAALPLAVSLTWPWILGQDVPPAALVPAAAFGFANGVMEEVVYRGALQAWLGRVMPMMVSIGIQSLVFGIVHAGPEVVALLPVHIALLTLVGLVGGIVRWRTGSLAIPIGIHVGADVALYVGLACRAAP